MAQEEINNDKDSLEHLNPEQINSDYNQAVDNSVEEYMLEGVGRIRNHSLVEEMEKSYLEYSMSVIVSRALPDIRDGLKPVHRRILYTMYNTGLRANVKYRKSATVVGDVLGKYHPHGDAAIYQAMVRLGQDFNMRYCLVDGQGNFGSIDGFGAAAARYTEARMTKIAEELLFDIDKDTVDFVPNYSNTLLEPRVLPAKIPNILLNGSMGIAVGMATNIPPHNLSELCSGLIMLIDKPETTITDLHQVIKGPDFPTGGIILDDGGVTQAFSTGKGRIVIRAVANIEENEKKGNSRIVITELPYQLSKNDLIAKMAELIADKKITGLADIRDESDRYKGLKLVVELKKDAYPQKVLNQLFKLTPLQSAFHVNLLALVDGVQPRVLNLETVLKEWLKHRGVVVRRRTEYELRKASARAHILTGLKIALDQIDAVISTIRASKTPEEALNSLIKKFGLSQLQAGAILKMQLRTLSGLERKKIEDELKELEKFIAECNRILSSEANILAIIREEIVYILEKYGDKRKTQIVTASNHKFSDEDLIPNERVVINMTAGNYIKRLSIDTYSSQARGGRGKMGMGTKEEDIVTTILQASNHDSILFFTSLGRVFKLKVYEIPQGSRTAKGQSIVNLINLAPNETVTSTITLDKNSNDGYLFMCTVKGTVKKTSIDEYHNIRTNGLIAIKLDSGDELGWVKLTSGGDDIIISTALAQANRFNEKDVKNQGRATRGMRGIKLKAGDKVVGVDNISPEDKDTLLLVVHSNGYGKRTLANQFSTHKRGGVGVKAGVVNTKTGHIIDVRAIASDNQEIILSSQLGVVIRLRLKDISKISRVTQGVRIMKLTEGDAVTSIAMISAQAQE